ncbi:glycosyltransferase family A protein [Bifidobacterium moraviense]|uniref:glycosyltransferase family 2 protein n=1 Tax=Bifidobacterium moraviense TaxID=2675323 RepID=UPI002FF7DBA1
MSSSAASASDVTVIITSFDQGRMPVAAARSALRQTMCPARVIVVDDGSTDPASVAALDELSALDGVTLIRQTNAGVSAARNAGIAAARTPYICVLDGDDLLMPGFLASAVALLDADPHMVAASSWLKCYGVLDCVVRPGGGRIEDFLPRNACPADCVFRRELWERAGGYDETMREGFEDWEFMLRLLEAGGEDTAVGIVPEPLINYRTAPGSSNVRSMRRRTRLLGRIIERHRASYAAHMESALLALDALAGERLGMWEDAVQVHPELRQHSMRTRGFLEHPSYGDGGMASAVRINRARCSAPFYPADAS